MSVCILCWTTGKDCCFRWCYEPSHWKAIFLIELFKAISDLLFQGRREDVEGNRNMHTKSAVRGSGRVDGIYAVCALPLLTLLTNPTYPPAPKTLLLPNPIPSLLHQAPHILIAPLCPSIPSLFKPLLLFKRAIKKPIFSFAPLSLPDYMQTQGCNAALQILQCGLRGDSLTFFMCTGGYILSHKSYKSLHEVEILHYMTRE